MLHYADLFNGVLFGGEEVLDPQRLKIPMYLGQIYGWYLSL